MEENSEDELVIVLDAVPRGKAGEVLARLGFAEIEVHYRENEGTFLVRASDLEAAREALDDFDPAVEDEPSPNEDAQTSDAVFWSRRGLSGLAAVLVACGLVFWSTHLSGTPLTRSRLLEHGAISWSLVEKGETWRLLSAVFVHFDGEHLLANLLTLALVVPPLAHHLGAGRFLLVFVLTGVAGNAISHWLMPTMGLKAGASGAITGVLGALAGQTLRPQYRGRLHRWQILGALGAIYALLVGIGPGRDNIAHAAGLMAGLILGRLLQPPDPLDRSDRAREPT